MNTYHSALKPGGSTHLHEGEGYLLSRALISIKRLVCFYFHTLQHWFLSWTRPPKTSLLLGMVADRALGEIRARCRKRALTKASHYPSSADHTANVHQKGSYPLSASGKDGSDLEASALDRPAGDASTLAPRRISPILAVQVKSHFSQTKGESLDDCVD